MPFFQGVKGAITMTGCPITDVGGDMYHHDYSHHENNQNSNNKTTHTTTNSHNDLSTTEEGNEKTYNTYTDGRRVISGMAHTIVRGNNRSPRGTGVLHALPRRTDRNAARSTERAQQQNLEGREYEYQSPRREKGPERLLEERQSRMHGNAERPWAEYHEPAERERRQNLEERESYEYQPRPVPARRPEESQRRMYGGAEHPWQENNYEPAQRMQRQDSDEDELYEYYPPAPARRSGGRRPMYGHAGHTQRENYDMDVDEAPSPPKYPSPGRPSLNPFLSQPPPPPPAFPTPAQYAYKSEPQLAPHPQRKTFDEFTASAWGDN